MGKFETWSALLANYYSGDKIKNYEMGGTCGTYELEQGCPKSFGGDT
jgi:hypothetical protein